MIPRRFPKPRQIFWLTFCLSTFLSLSAAYPEDAAKGTGNIQIENFTFMPGSLTVKAGTRVTFVNHDDIPHLVVAADGTIRSKALDTDDSFALTLQTPGEFIYFCGLHPQMTGKIVVVP